MNQTLDEISIGNKKFVLNKKQYFSEQQIQNSIENKDIETNLNQFQFFSRTVKSQIIMEDFNEEKLTSFLKEVYLDTYSKLIKLFLNSQNNSIFLKSKEQLNTDFDGGRLFQNLNFFSLIDVQQLKDDLFDSFNKNPCLVVNTQVNTSLEPLQIELIKTNLKLSCRAHILDFKLRTINLVSIFDNSEFYKLDDSLITYLFLIYVERLKQISQSYYNSLKEILIESLESSLNNGEEIISSITDQQVDFIVPINSSNKEENFLKYLRLIFENEFVNISNNLTEFFKIKIIKNGSEFKLSNSYFVQDYFLSTIPTITERSLGSIQNSTFAFLILTGIDENSGKDFITLNLVIKNSLTSFSNRFVVVSKSEKIILNERFTTIENLDQETLSLLKNQILNSNSYKIMFDFCFPLNKILNFSCILSTIMCSNYYENCNQSFFPSLKTCANIHNSIIGENDSDKCETIDANLSFGFNLEILKILIQAPIQIFKGLVETYDPNIFVSSKLKTAAESLGTPDVSIIPYSAALMVPPPFGPSLIPSQPGFIYWGISAAETIGNLKKNGINGLDLEYSGSFDLKNPFKPLC